MTDKEKEAIEDLMQLVRDKDEYIQYHSWVGIATFENINIALNLIQKQQKEIEKLKKHNKDLLRKLRNRVKEVKKLAKYSLYKKEFANLNKVIQKQQEVIKKQYKTMNKMAGYIDLVADEYIRKMLKDDDVAYYGSKYCIIQFFEKKAEEE